MKKTNINLSKNKKNKYFIGMFSLLLAFLMIFSFIPTKQVNAETLTLDDNQIIEQGSGIYKIYDASLYGALLDTYNAENPSHTVSKLTVGLFKNFTNLNLSEKQINDFSGLYYFKFDNLTSLDLSNNNLNGSFKDFQFFASLKNLNLSNNKLTGFENNFSNVLENIDLSNNKLTSVNLGTVSENAIINLSFNNLSSFDNITLPQSSCEISFTHNLLTDELPQNPNINFKMGLQGVIQNADLLKSSVIKFYTLENVQNLILYKKVGETYEFVQNISENSSLTNLNINSYKVSFNQTGTLYEDIYFTVRPNLPDYKFFDENGTEFELKNNIVKQILELKLTGDGELYYSINRNPAVNSNSYKISKSGSYTITIWQKVDGVDSLKTNIFIISKYFNPLSLVWVLLGILFFVAMFYAGIRWKNSFSSTTKTTKSNLSGKGFN